MTSTGSGCGRATGCSTWAAAPAGTPSRCTAAAPTWSPSTRTPTSWPGCATCSPRWRRPARCPTGAEADVKEGDALALPFADGEFDRVVAAEILEHVPADIQAIAGAGPGAAARRHDRAHRAALVARGRLLEALPASTTTPPAATSGSTPTRSSSTKAENAGLELDRQGLRPRPALAVLVAQVRGRRRQRRPTRPCKAYHRLLVWDIMKRPRATRCAERVLDPVIGKSLVLYFRKPDALPTRRA